MTFIPTSQCPIFPEYARVRGDPLPLPELTDEQIDDALAFLLERGAFDYHLPATQYGRRIAVQACLRYERAHPHRR